MTTLLSSLSITTLIFGGCCSNVFALEALIRTAPSSGLLITFSQFLFVATTSYITQFSPTAPYTLSPPRVPLRKWAYIAALFYAVNMLNNWAFAFRISVPVHIILRSFGSVITMLAGWCVGKTYSPLQILSVAVLTAGVVVTSWADAEGKGKSLDAGSDGSNAQFSAGLGVLLLAQVLSAYMGVYVQETYAQHGASWTENLFYSHALSLPLFVPLAPLLQRQWRALADTAPIDPGFLQSLTKVAGLSSPLLENLLKRTSTAPRGLLLLLSNAIMQLACISGVNLLSAKSSAVTVTIVLNVRKLVSFILSTVLFGHALSAKMALGAALVFGSGAIYGFESTVRIPRRRRRREMEGKKGE
ncbi:hypothetical protein MBLNU457_g0795t1 [Dothideomycetes sp. NU457]